MGKKGTFIKDIPDDLHEQLIPKKSVAVFDDVEEMLLNDKSKLRLLLKFSKIFCHHKKLILIVLLQSYDIFYRHNVLNSLLSQTTMLVLFKSVNNFSSIKRWLNSYGIKLMGNQNLFEVYHDLVTNSCYNYLIIDLNQSLKRPHVYTNILFEDPKPFIKYHFDSDCE